MKTFTIADIRSWEPCYDPNKHLPEDWSGTVLEILNYKTISFKDKLWVVCREDLIDAKTLRLFAVWCARQVEHLMTDNKSKHALDVAERFAHDKATSNELACANAAADAGAAAADAARAARAARAGDAAVAVAAAYAADAAYAAAVYAAYSAADAAARAGDAAAAAAARAAQIAQLIKMVQE